jgi:hypothetical protein
MTGKNIGIGNKNLILISGKKPPGDTALSGSMPGFGARTVLFSTIYVLGSLFPVLPVKK